MFAKDIISEVKIAREIWKRKYRFSGPDGVPVDKTVVDSFRRVADALSLPESKETRGKWADRFYELMAGMWFLPAGRVLAGAGTGRSVTLFNCFVMGTIDDSISGIFGN